MAMPARLREIESGAAAMSEDHLTELQRGL
jgi:hypothetical protein